MTTDSQDKTRRQWGSGDPIFSPTTGPSSKGIGNQSFYCYSCHLCIPQHFSSNSYRHSTFKMIKNTRYDPHHSIISSIKCGGLVTVIISHAQKPDPLFLSYPKSKFCGLYLQSTSRIWTPVIISTAPSWLQYLACISVGSA